MFIKLEENNANFIIIQNNQNDIKNYYEKR